MFNVASDLYAAGSAAGSMFSLSNLGTEGETPSQIWAFRACVIGGSQNLLIDFLWYWGGYLTRNIALSDSSYTPSSITLTAMSIPVAIFRFGISVLLYLGLAEYYRQDPGAMTLLYKALFRYRIIVWFWVMVILQDYAVFDVVCKDNAKYPIGLPPLAESHPPTLTLELCYVSDVHGIPACSSH